MGSNFSRWLTKVALLTSLAIAASAFFVFPDIAPLLAAVAVLASLWFVTGSPLAERRAAFLDMAAAQPMLKEYYEGAKVENLAMQKNVALAMVPKDTDAEGKYVTVPTVWEVSQGISSNFQL